MRSAVLLPLVLCLLPARAGAEGSTLTSVKVGACALLTAADAQRVANAPMQVQAAAPASDSPGRSCVYGPARPGRGLRAVQLRLLDAREWSNLGADAGAAKPARENVKGIGDEAYLIKEKPARQPAALVLFVRRGRSQFFLRFAGARLQLTDPMKQLARTVAGRL
jgi:hypothetical protein